MKRFTKVLMIMAMTAWSSLLGQSKANAGPTNLTITSVIFVPSSEFTALKNDFTQLKTVDIASLKAQSDTHIAATNNPHQVTKIQVGLSDVDNIKQIPITDRGAANGVAALDANCNLVFDEGRAKIYGNGANTFSYSFDGSCRLVTTSIGGICTP